MKHRVNGACSPELSFSSSTVCLDGEGEAVVVVNSVVVSVSETTDVCLDGSGVLLALEGFGSHMVSRPDVYATV